MAEIRYDFAVRCRQLAEEYANENDPGQAFFHYLVSLEFMPEWKNELKNSFSSVVCSFGKILEHEKRYEDLFRIYEYALKFFPDNEVILNNVGAHLCRLKQLNEASLYFKKALLVNQHYLPAYRNLEITKSHLVERWHFRMLNDSLRNESYERSICKKINCDFKTVLDIGTGTGILSIYAKKSGAGSIYSCDYSPTMISIAENVLEANSLGGSIVLINKLSNELTIPEDIPVRLSMAVTETFDGGLLGEHILSTLIHAWENLLEPQINEEGQSMKRVIPQGAVLFITPIESQHIARKHYLINSNRTKRCSFNEGLNLSHLKKLYTISTDPYDTENLRNLTFISLGPTKKLFEFDFNDLSELKRFYCGDKDKSFMIEINKQGYFDALAVWFELMLDSETTITSSPFSKNSCCCWEQAIFPMTNEHHLNEKSVVSIFASCLNGKLSVTAKSLENDSNSSVGTTQTVVRFLNCETLLLVYIKVLDHIKRVFPDKRKVTVLDLSFFPYTGLLLSKCFDATVYASSQHLELLPSKEELFIYNNINEDKVIFKTWPEILKILDQKNERFDIIVIEVLTTAGEINEEIISLIPLLRNVLNIDGILLPVKVIIHCQLIFSTELANLSKMDVDRDQMNIAQFINEYKVSHMVDFKLEEIKYTEMSDCFAMAVLDVDNIVNEELIFEKEIDIHKPGDVNTVLYWFTINYTTDIHFSSKSPDSHINQAAMLLETSKKIGTDLKMKLTLRYNSGAMKFSVM